MAPPPESEERFELIVPAEASNVAAVRLFGATVIRTLGGDGEVVDDLKLAVSEVASAIVAQGRAVDIRMVATHRGLWLTFAVGPIGAGDLADDTVDPFDIVMALFPDTARDPATSSVVIPVPLQDEP